MLPQAQLLPQISVKGYRELLKRLRQHGRDEAAPSSALFQQARALALAHVQRRQTSGRADPRRAFTRLRARLMDSSQGLKQLKDQKKKKLLSRCSALLQQSRTKKESAEHSTVVSSSGITQALVVGAVGLLSRGFMKLANTTEIRGAEHLEEALNRPPDRGLVTVSNHSAALDDPLLLAAMMPLASLTKPESVRWGMCATDRCFKNRLMSSFFRAGKTLPVERGAGLDQPGMLAAQARLSSGDWVHIFPEGTRSRDGKMGSMRRGVGHLVASCSTLPIVLPFVHSGMEGLLPSGSSIPRLGRSIRVLVGEPLDLADLQTSAQAEEWTPERLSTAIAQRIGDALYMLKARLEGISVAEVCRAPMSGADDAALNPLIEEQIDALQHSWLAGSLPWKVPIIHTWALGDHASNSQQHSSAERITDRNGFRDLLVGGTRGLQLPTWSQFLQYTGQRTAAMQQLVQA